MQNQAAAIQALSVLYQAIAAAGTEGIPSGHLYALSLGAFDGLSSYEACVGLLVRSGLVKKTGQVLTAEVLNRG